MVASSGMRHFQSIILMVGAPIQYARTPSYRPSLLRPAETEATCLHVIIQSADPRVLRRVTG